MPFSDNQLAALRAPLHPDHVASREQSGRKLSYIEGWHAIAEANRIFGFDAWDRQTIELRCVAENPRLIGRGDRQKEGFGVSYIARVRVTVRTEDREIVREGVGNGHGIDADIGLAHESAAKEAETDAMKRALMTFGNPFGLALYDKSQANVSALDVDALADFENGIVGATSSEQIEQLMIKYGGQITELHGVNRAEWQRLSALVRDKKKALAAPQQGEA
jgi:DNA recombination protein Rad52